MPPSIISIGGATFDLFVITQEALTCVEIGSKIPVERVIECCGGGASNSSVGLQRLGCQASFAGIIGSDQWGQHILQNFAKEGVNTDAATIVENETTSFSIVISIPGKDRTIFYTPGTNMHLVDATFDRERVSACQWIYLNHLHEQSCQIQDDLLAMLSTVKGPGLTWNPGGCQIDQGISSDINCGLLQNTDILLLNKEEALAFSQTKTTEEALAVFRIHGVRITCITDGKRGVMAADREHIYHCPSIAEAPVVDTTGAGDAFGVGVTWGILSGADLPKSLRAGTINATSVIGTIGAETGLLTDTQMQAQLEAVRLDVEEISSL